jgi:hypothetical protein
MQAVNASRPRLPYHDVWRCYGNVLLVHLRIRALDLLHDFDQVLLAEMVRRAGAGPVSAAISPFTGHVQESYPTPSALVLRHVHTIVVGLRDWNTQLGGSHDRRDVGLLATDHSVVAVLNLHMGAAWGLKHLAPGSRHMGLAKRLLMKMHRVR